MNASSITTKSLCRLSRLEGELVKCRKEVEVYLAEKARLEDELSFS